MKSIMREEDKTTCRVSYFSDDIMEVVIGFLDFQTRAYLSMKIKNMKKLVEDITPCGFVHLNTDLKKHVYEFLDLWSRA